MAPLAVRDVEPRRHPLPAVVRQAARRAEAAEAPRRDAPAAAHHVAVHLGDLLERRVLRVDRRPLEARVARVLLALINVQDDHLVDLHVPVLHQPLAAREDSAKVLSHLER